MKAFYTTLTLLMKHIPSDSVVLWDRRNKTILATDYDGTIASAQRLSRHFTTPGGVNDDDTLYEYEFVSLVSAEVTTLAYDPTARWYVREVPSTAAVREVSHEMMTTDVALANKKAHLTVPCEPALSLLYAVACALKNSGKN